MKIGILEGDDIGLEVVPECIKVMKAAAARTGVNIDWRPLPIGKKALDELGNTFPPGTLETLDTLDGWVLGPIGHRAYPKTENAKNPHPVIRQHFELYANIKPVKSYPTLPALHQNVDLVILRELLEGMPPDRNTFGGYGEFRPSPDMTVSVRVITRRSSNRIARAAFDLARTRRKKVTAVHKNTVFKLGCGMFSEECHKVAAEYPDVTFDEVMVDTFAMKLVMQPQQFDVVVTTNTFGDILTDEAAGLVGGLGMAPGIAAGPRHAMAQATHGSAPDIAGRNIANPYAMIMSGQMLLEHLGRVHDEPKAVAAGQLIERAMEKVIAERRALTPDLGGDGGTSQMGDAIAAAVAA
jgi:3-isopropylmalate dehydrogenase